jgi:hypothetical protein
MYGNSLVRRGKGIHGTNATVLGLAVKKADVMVKPIFQLNQQTGNQKT